jgi:hypothetical protein
MIIFFFTLSPTTSSSLFKHTHAHIANKKEKEKAFIKQRIGKKTKKFIFKCESVSLCKGRSIHGFDKKRERQRNRFWEGIDGERRRGGLPWDI